MSTASAEAASIRRWLLDGPAQVSGGEHDGAVVGSFDALGRPSYVYVEITGYWLHWLADLDVAPAARSTRAERAVAWCLRQFEHRAPPTRIVLNDGASDWRNDAVFLFDLAMLAGGLARAAEAGLVADPIPLAHRLIDECVALVRDGELQPLRALHANTLLPDRWSTRLDNFELKAATRVLMLQRILPLPAPLADACERLCARLAPRTASAAVELLHPTLYFMEGAVTRERACWPGVAHLLDRVLDLANRDGELPEDPARPAAVLRSDVIAQALRVGLVLHRHGVEGAPSPERLAPLAAALCARVRSDGAVPFQPGDPPLANTWCAMFAEQALRWWTQSSAPAPEALV